MSSGEPASKCQHCRDDSDGEEIQERNVTLSCDRLRDRQTPEEGERSDDGENAACKLPAPKGYKPDQDSQVRKLSNANPDRRERLSWVQEPLLQMRDEKHPPEQKQSESQSAWYELGELTAMPPTCPYCE